MRKLLGPRHRALDGLNQAGLMCLHAPKLGLGQIKFCRHLTADCVGERVPQEASGVNMTAPLAHLQVKRARGMGKAVAIPCTQ